MSPEVPISEFIEKPGLAALTAYAIASFGFRNEMSSAVCGLPPGYATTGSHSLIGAAPRTAVPVNEIAKAPFGARTEMFAAYIAAVTMIEPRSLMRSTSPPRLLTSPASTMPGPVVKPPPLPA